MKYINYKGAVFDPEKGLTKNYVKNVDFLIEIYKEDRNKINIPVEEIDKLSKEPLNRINEVFIKKWKTGRKYLRTATSIESFSMDKYPKESLTISLNEDIRINCLDDLYDDEMTKAERGVYIGELLRVNCSLHKDLDKKQSKIIEKYYKDILLVLFGENSTNNVLKNMYYRSHDITLFYELPLSYFDEKKGNKNRIVEQSKYLRMINLFKKDMYDIEHDLKNGTDSIIIDAYNNNELEELTNKFSEFVIKGFEKNNVSDNSELEFISKNIKKQIHDEIVICEYKLENIIKNKSFN